MLFQTPTFGLFLVVVVVVATLLDKRAKLHQGFLLLASWLFYASWDARFLGLILFSTILDYSIGLAIPRARSQRGRKALLIVSLVGNLSVLGLFKYFDFFIDNLNRLLQGLGFEASLPLLHLILPVGISFYTFQTLSYTIDIYDGTLEPRKSIVQFALFVAFFPQLVAGPIVRARQFLPQLDRRPEYDQEVTGTGIYLILKGLVKKVVFADVIGSYLVNPVFADPAGHPGFWVLLAAWGFRFQIYGDFSGYSDIAIGCGRLLGFELPVNFRSPFKATSFSNYWSRWHITLGSWFRDYVYFPLYTVTPGRGSKPGLWRGNLNVLITWTLIGLWHGAAWTFVLWGTLHALCLIGERIYRAIVTQRPPRQWLAPFKAMAVFHTTLLAMLVFRAPDLATVKSLFDAAAQTTSGLAAIPTGVWVAFALAVITHFLPDKLKDGAEAGFGRSPAALQATAIVLVLLLLRLVGRTVEPFYYFQF